jgi:hypothetical protein
LHLDKLYAFPSQYNNGILICSLPGILFIIFQNH